MWESIGAAFGNPITWVVSALIVIALTVVANYFQRWLDRKYAGLQKRRIDKRLKEDERFRETVDTFEHVPDGMTYHFHLSQRFQLLEVQFAIIMATVVILGSLLTVTWARAFYFVLIWICLLFFVRVSRLSKFHFDVALALCVRSVDRKVEALRAQAPDAGSSSESTAS